MNMTIHDSYIRDRYNAMRHIPSFNDLDYMVVRFGIVRTMRAIGNATRPRTLAYATRCKRYERLIGYLAIIATMIERHR